MTITVGIDPGLTGAIGILENGHFQSVHDMPVINKGSGKVKWEVDVTATINLLRQKTRKDGEPEDFVSCVIERVHAHPQQGVSSVFSLGDSFGSARACVASVSKIELRYVTPQVWKKYFGLTADKEQARALALTMFPDAPINLKKHSDRSEALLMSRWLWETEYQ